MEILIGEYCYLTKIHLLALKEKLEFEYKYVRDDFDYIFITKDKDTTIKITQDGLISLRTKGEVEDVPDLIRWLEENILRKIKLLDGEDEFYENLLVDEKHSIILINPKENIQKIYGTLGRKYDYNIKTKLIEKNYGDGLVIYNNIKISKQELYSLIEYQILFGEYQNLMREILKYNRNMWHVISQIRKKETLKIKDLPTIIDELLDKKRKNTFILKRVMQIKDFISQRKEKCQIIGILKTIKMDDFGEMIRLNNYVTDQFSMTNEYILSTMNLIEYVYKENEQIQMNILQIIFAIGTIASLINLSQISNDTMILHTAQGNIVADLITYDFNDMIVLTIVSVVIGIVLYALINFFFMYKRKLNISTLLEKNKLE